MGTDVVIGTSWSHRLARILVRPLVGSGVTPNDLTTLRLATGLLACGALFPADGAGAWWGGWLWLVSALLDPPHGELARLGGLSTPRGPPYYYLLHKVVNSPLLLPPSPFLPLPPPP